MVMRHRQAVTHIVRCTVQIESSERAQAQPQGAMGTQGQAALQTTSFLSEYRTHSVLDLGICDMARGQAVPLSRRRAAQRL